MISSARGPGGRRGASLLDSSSQKPSPGGSSYDEQAELVAAAVARPAPTLRPLFIGSGGYGDILNCVTRTKNRHFLVPTEVEKALSQEDLAYLQHKGCFSLPSESRALIRAYFSFVHPSFPVIDGPAFCQDCADGRLDRVNLLLLWSMLSVAASYVPGYATHSIKRSFVERATLLFHLTHENDKIILVQSALLLSFWFDEAEDIKQSWYWTGTAFSLAQSLGLHQDFSGPSIQHETVRCNLWRACTARDAWLSFGMGRPLRLHSEDWSVPSKPSSDYQFCDITLFDDRMQLYNETDRAELLATWQRLLQLSCFLRRIISTSSSRSLTLSDAIDALADDVETDGASLPLTVLRRHFKLHQCAARTAFYQHQGEVAKAKSAIAETTSTLRAFLADTTIEYVAPTAIPLLVPAISIYLGEDEAGAHRDLDNGIDVYIQFLKAIEANFPAAAILKRLVFAALKWTDRKA